jgi:photosystem II stability/assembly factor-like uncharacterized protein
MADQSEADMGATDLAVRRITRFVGSAFARSAKGSFRTPRLTECRTRNEQNERAPQTGSVQTIWLLKPLPLLSPWLRLIPHIGTTIGISVLLMFFSRVSLAQEEESARISSTHQMYQFLKSSYHPQHLTSVREGIDYSPVRSVESTQPSAWQWLNPLPQANTLKGIWLFNTDTIVAVGDGGTILRSTNRGVTWSIKYDRRGGDDDEFTAVAFSDFRCGVTVSLRGVILRTTDQGMSWNAVKNPWGGMLLAVRFLDSLNGYAVGNGGILRTRDAGKTWTFIPGFETKIWLAVSMGDTNRVIVVGQGGEIASTRDGGKTWNSQNVGSTFNLYGVTHVSPDEAFTFGSAYPSSVLLHTTDGGLSWEPRSVRNTFFAMAFFDRSHGLAVGDGVYTTNDTGTTWASTTGSPGGAFGCLSFAGPTAAAMAGQGGRIFLTTDRGQSWMSLTAGPTWQLNAIAFADRKTGVATSYQGMLLTTDGGSSWSMHAQERGLGAVAFAGSSMGTAVGEGGNIVYTADGGRTWQQANYLRRGTSLRAVGFFNDRYGIVAGDSALVYKSTDGGFNWSVLENSRGPSHILGVDIVDSLKIVAVGTGRNGPTVRQTTDGGLSWEEQVVSWPGAGTNANDEWANMLWSVSFLDAKRGFAVGASNYSQGPQGFYGGVILRTTDSGHVWTLHSTYQGLPLRAVSMKSDAEGTIVGEYGTVLHTTNGGEDWTFEQTPSKNPLSGLSYVANGPGYVRYACGSWGTILFSVSSPLPAKTWTWTGRVDSSWNTPDNWTPAGVPLPGDSVIIPEVPQNPVIYQEQQQIVVASLMILPGGKLTITDALKRFVVLGDVFVYGTLEITPGAQVSIVTGGSWVVRPGGASILGFRKNSLLAGADRGFLAAKSTVYFLGNGTFENNFYDLIVDSAVVMQSTGDVSVSGTIATWGEVVLRNVDTLFVSNDDPQAMVGRGKVIGRGTTRRAIRKGMEENYQFESPNTFIRFTSGSTPAFVGMRTYAGVDPDSVSSSWAEVPSRADPATHRVIADSVRGFSRWTIKIPRPVSGGGAAVQRVYDLESTGGDSFAATLSLHYEVSEVPAGFQESELRLFRTESLGEIPNDGVGSAIPQHYELLQNYPNPFNPSTTIRYGLPHNSVVQLTVFNTLGQQVTVLQNGEQEAGYHEVKFDGRGLSSGVYFYRLQAGNFVETRKLLFVR